MIIPDLHIISEIRGGDLRNAEIRLIVDKKVRYANGFRKMKKALNIALDLRCEGELINIITDFINQKKTLLEDINNDNTYSKQLVILNSLVTKRHGRPPTKRLKSSSENASYEKSNCQNQQAVNPQDPNLFIRSKSNDRISLSDVVDNQIASNDLAELYNKGKRKKYVCKVCGKTGHNACNKLKCRQHNDNDM